MNNNKICEICKKRNLRKINKTGLCRACYNKVYEKSYYNCKKNNKEINSIVVTELKANFIKEFNSV